MRWIWLLVVACCLPGSVGAAEIGKGAVEITAAGGFSHESFDELDGHITSLRAQVGVLKAASRKIQLGARLGLNHQSIDLGAGGETDGGSLSADAVLRVNVSTERSVIPYFEAGAGVIVWAGDLEGDKNTILIPQLAVGIRTIVHDVASFNVQVGWAREGNAFGAADVDADVFLVQFGFSVFPRGLDGSL